MYAVERRRWIVTTAREAGRVEVAEVARTLEVAPETIRRDLNALEAPGLLRRVHGGAVRSSGSASRAAGPPHRLRQDEKTRIAVQAATMISGAETLYLDAGSTVQALAERLRPARPVTVVTNALPVAMLLAGRPGVSLLLVGGRVRGHSLGTVDHWAIRMLDELVIDLAVLGTNGISVERGLTCPDAGVAAVKSAAVAVSRRRMLLADGPSSASTPPTGSPTCATSRPSSPTGSRASATSAHCAPSASRWWLRDRHGHAEPVPRPDLRPAPRLDPRTEVHRAKSSSIEASGKGVNVSRTLARMGVPTIAVLPVAGATGRQLLDLLDADGVEHRAVEQSGMTRINTSVVQPGHTTKVNAPSPPATTAEIDMLVASTAAALAHARAADPGSAHWLAVCGSLAGGRAEDVLRRLVAVAHQAGARCAVDTSSGRARRGGRAGADLLSPNATELSDLVGPDAAFATGGTSTRASSRTSRPACAADRRPVAGQPRRPRRGVDGRRRRPARGRAADRAAEPGWRRRRAAGRLARRSGGREPVERGERRGGRRRARPRHRRGARRPA
jgi:DeoR family fructose operon transcriptional repressor